MPVKKIYIFLMGCLLMTSLAAQERLFIKGRYPDCFIEHRVRAAETLASIAIKYAVTTSQLARINGRSPMAALPAGSLIRIPLTAANFTYGGNQKSNSVFYEVTESKMDLNKLNQLFPALTIAQLKKSNPGVGNSVIKGQTVLIGSLSGAVSIVKETRIPDKAIAETVVVIPEEKPVVRDSGFFAKQFLPDMEERKLITVQHHCDFFEARDGTGNGKYYVLINDIPPGTIVRIELSAQQVVYALVLGPLPVKNEADSITLWMDTGIKKLLGIQEARGKVRVHYYQ